MFFFVVRPSLLACAETFRAATGRGTGRCGAKLYLEGKAESSASSAQAALEEDAATRHGEGSPKRERERTGTPPRATTSRTSTFDQLQQLMEWHRAGLLSQVEFQKAKDKILGEEPSVPRMPHMPAPPSMG